MNIKKLNEERAEKQKQMEDLLSGVKAEERAFTEDEDKLFNELKSGIELINKTLSAFEESRKLEETPEKGGEESRKAEEPGQRGGGPPGAGESRRGGGKGSRPCERAHRCGREGRR